MSYLMVLLEAEYKSLENSTMHPANFHILLLYRPDQMTHNFPK